MDLLKEIRDKINSNSDRANSRGLKSVLTHIEIAERYYHRAKAERDEHLYTDVIYRTNEPITRSKEFSRRPIRLWQNGLQTA